MNPFRKPQVHFIALIIGIFLPAIIACSFNGGTESAEVETKVAAEQEPGVSIDYVYYKIRGATANELRAQMDQLGPVDRFGHRHDMDTQWEVNWNYPFTFPTWEPPPGASAELVDQWNSYLKLGQIHEDGHKEVALEASREILQAFQATPAQSSCDLLEQEVDQKGQALLEQFRQKEIAYDETTDHGATQGARFP
jgi:predicted secreted Zn-dependent protease